MMCQGAAALVYLRFYRVASSPAMGTEPRMATFMNALDVLGLT